jgi:hypothetical protein
LSRISCLQVAAKVLVDWPQDKKQLALIPDDVVKRNALEDKRAAAAAKKTRGDRADDNSNGNGNGVDSRLEERKRLREERKETRDRIADEQQRRADAGEVDDEHATADTTTTTAETTATATATTATAMATTATAAAAASAGDDVISVSSTDEKGSGSSGAARTATRYVTAASGDAKLSSRPIFNPLIKTGDAMTRMLCGATHVNYTRTDTSGNGTGGGGDGGGGGVTDAQRAAGLGPGFIPRHRFTKEHLLKGSVDILEFAPHEPFAEAMAARGRPAIIRRSVVQTWPCFTDERFRWTRASLEKAFADYHAEQSDGSNNGGGGDDNDGGDGDGGGGGSGVYADVKRSKSWRVVDLDLSQPMTKLQSLRPAKVRRDTLTYDTVNMTGTAFWQSIAEPEDDLIYYWFGAMLDSLKDDVLPNDFLFLSDEDEQKYEQYMWISSRGPNMHTHFDQDHNFFVQVYGQKRFTLFPPSDHDKMYLYPRVHPLWHKSQVDYDSR